MAELKSLQEAFDVMIGHLRDQNKQALDSNGSCKYRTISGLKCVVGVLIRDEYYSTTMDLDGGVAADHSSIKKAIINSGYEYDAEFYCEMQDVHDSVGYYIRNERTVYQLRIIAGDYNLKFDESVLGE